jgi:hypothetical protein
MEDRTVASCFAFVGGAFQMFTSIYLFGMVINGEPSYWGRLFLNLASIVGGSFQVLGAIGFVFSLLIFAGAILMLKRRTVVPGSAIVVACSLLSFPFTLSGVIIGMLFGLIGGLVGYATSKPYY